MSLTPRDLKLLEKRPVLYRKTLSENLHTLAENPSGGGGGTGSVNNASNLGAGTGVFASKAVDVLQFKSLQGAGGIVLSNNATEITITGTTISLPQSAGWNSTYTTVNENSAVQWNYQGTDLRSLSANWQSSYNQVNTLSAAWMLSGTEVDLGDIPALSGSWNSAFTTVNTNSADWQSTYNTVCSLSSTWGANYISGALLASYDSRYVNVTGDSMLGNLNMGGYNITGVGILSATAIYSISSFTQYMDITLYELSGFNVMGNVEITGNVIVDGNVTADNLLIDSWNSTRTTVNSNSAGWESTEASVNNLSGYIQPTYTTVNENSANWGSVYTTVNTNSGIWISDISSLSGQIIDLNTNLHIVSTDLESMIDSVSASIQSITGQYEMNFADFDWVGPSPYSITIPPATHYQGSTKNLNVVVKEDFGSENKIVYDSPSINDNGTVILTTTTPYSGSVIIGKMGGFTASDVTNAKKGQITCIFDGLGTVLATGLKTYVLIENNAVIEGWTATGDGNTGSIVVDVWKCPYASFPPTVANTIAGTEKPTIAGAKTNQDSNLTTWTTQINANDYIGFNVDSCSTFTKASITLKISK